MVVFLLLFAIVVPLLSIAAIVLTFIASWKVHEKAGLPGWSGIINIAPKPPSLTADTALGRG